MEMINITSATSKEDLTRSPSVDHRDVYLDALESGHPIINNYSSNQNEKAKIRSWTARLQRSLLQFFTITSFHGLPHIGNASSRKSYCQSVYWIILIIIALVAMTWAVVSVTIEYTAMNTSLQSRQALKNSVPFPAVTICNQNLFRKSVVSNATDITDDLVTFLNFLAGNLIVLRSFDYTTFLDKYGKQLFADESSVFFYKNSGHQLQNMLIACRYGGEFKNCTFKQRSSTSGNCYTFNSAEDEPILYTTESGYLFGLELVLNAEEYEYFLMESDSVGFNVFIHDPNHFPHYGGVGSFSASTGQLTDVALNRVDYKLLTSSSGGQCSNGVKLKYFKTYSRTSCRSECITDFVVDLCNCKAEFMPGPAAICRISNTCWFETLAEFEELNCNCPVACDFTTYEKTLSYAKYPATHLTDALNSSSYIFSQNFAFPEFLITTGVDENGTEVSYLNDNFSASFMQNNLAKIRIYYDSLYVATTEEILDYTTFQFIADFGGHIGLFTGAGFLTLFEIIELCYALKSDDDDNDDRATE